MRGFGGILGWTIDYIPIMININQELDVEEQLKSYSQQYSGAPNFGLTFNALKYLSKSPAVREAFKAMPRAEFNIN